MNKKKLLNFIAMIGNVLRRLDSLGGGENPFHL